MVVLWVMKFFLYVAKKTLMGSKLCTLQSVVLISCFFPVFSLQVKTCLSVGVYLKIFLFTSASEQNATASFQCCLSRGHG